VLDQHQQQVEGARSQRGRLPIDQQLPFGGPNLEAAEAKAVWQELLPGGWAPWNLTVSEQFRTA
jgi:hypothetical protein